MAWTAFGSVKQAVDGALVTGERGLEDQVTDNVGVILVPARRGRVG
ncbi:MAG TPA: hypothetical protein VI756_23195 [Blastocatellia bacterium]